jgi:transposase
MNPEIEIACPYSQLSKEELIVIIKALMTQNEALLKQNKILEERVAKLERQIGLKSSNSGKPPSSDGLTKKSRTQSERGKSGKSSGGQKGHLGSTLLQTETPDKIEDHYATVCATCGLPLEKESSVEIQKRQVFDMPPSEGFIVTEHRVHSQLCAGCAQETRGDFPSGVQAPVQYGSRISAIAVYCQNAHFIPEKRLSVLFKEVFAAKISSASLSMMNRRYAEKIAPVVKEICRQVEIADVKNVDETGFRIAGKTQWLHVASTLKFTHYKTSSKRGDIHSNLKGCVVHDYFKPYYTLGAEVSHALCNAHHLRELRALIEIEKESWAKRMQELLRFALKVTEHHREAGKVPEEEVRTLKTLYDDIVAEGLLFHESQAPLVRTGKRGRTAKRVGHNFLVRLRDKKEDVLRFLIEFNVPFTNNLAEQDIRMMKVKQKISGGFRSNEGAEDFASIRSVLSTARKLGWNIMNTLTQTADHLISSILAL